MSYGANTGWQVINNAGVPYDQLQLADINGDGRVDVFWANPSDGRWWGCPTARTPPAADDSNAPIRA